MSLETLTNTNFIILYRNKWYVFITSVYCQKKNWIDTKNTFHGCWNKIINYFAEKTFSVSEGALLNTLKIFFGKMKNVCRYFGALK